LDRPESLRNRQQSLALLKLLHQLLGGYLEIPLRLIEPRILRVVEESNAAANFAYDSSW
jgi:hypothetical protein